MTDISRRSLLAGAGGVGAVAIAGCTGSGDDVGGSVSEENGDDGSESKPEPEPPADPELDGTVLGEVIVENLANTEHTVDVLVEFDGEIEHWSTHTFDETSEGVTLNGDWPDDPGSFRVTARLDEGEFTQRTPTDWGNASCLNLYLLVERNEKITITGITDGGPCGSGDVDLTDAEDPDEEN